jgi:hypothetical protein
MRSTLVLSSLAAVAALGCGVPVDDPTARAGVIAQAIGEPMGGFPTPEERMGIMAINRARSDPATVKGPKSTIYPARPPILWDYDLSRSSRFHAINLRTSHVSLMHSSPCRLNANVGTSGCDGTTNCACAAAVGQSCQNCANVAAVNNCGTDTFTRIGYFSRFATGEVAAAGYSDAWAVVDGWVDEPAGADGHRTNLLDQGITSNVMGFGQTTGQACWSSFTVSDSGMQQGLAIPPIPSASPKPSAPAAGTVRFYAAGADAGGAPGNFNVVVDGKCSAMQLELGDPNLNSAWYSDVQLGAGCHSWWVLGTDGRGGRQTYPTTGALNVSVGGAGCGNDWSAQAPAADCEGAPPMPDLAGGGGRDLSTGGGAYDLAGGIHLDGGGTGKGSGKVGGACTSNADCASGICAFVGSSGYCTAFCDPTAADACPPPLVCGAIEGETRNYCVPSSGSGGGGGSDVNHGGGCSLAGARGSDRPEPAWLALAAAAMLFRRRRARR